jgi:signal transduction histidine kinase
MVMFGIVVRTVAAQNEERRRLLETLAAAERRAGVLEERQRLAREIHDTLAQGFAAILVHLEQVDVRQSRSVDSAQSHVEFARSVARENLEEARRMLTALRPEVLEQEAGLSTALERVCAEWQRRTGVRCVLAVTGTLLPLHSEVEVTLLRSTQELLANVRQHARARRVTVTLSYMDDVVALDVRDDGVGLAADVPNDCFGLRGLRERAEQLGGSMAVDSAAGEGTTVTLTIPAFRTETFAVPPEALGASTAPRPTAAQ